MQELIHMLKITGMNGQTNMMHTKSKYLLVTSLAVLSIACAPKQFKDLSAGHIGLESEVTEVKSNIPLPVTQVPNLPPPQAEEPLETYTVIVNEVPVKELLFALARDAKLNLDIYDDIKGTITINAIDQTLPQILDRISRQTNIRYQAEGSNLIVSSDTPFLKTYKVPYVNMSRNSAGQIDLSTQIAASGTVDVSTSGGGSRGAGSNNSTLSVKNNSLHDFWRTLFVNIAAMVGDKSTSQSGNQIGSDNVIVNRETGLLSVRATSKQHRDVQDFLDLVIGSAQRQVLIEATIVEIGLSNQYQAGVDWNRLTTNLVEGFPDGISVEQQLIGGNLGTSPATVLTYGDIKDKSTVSASVRLLEEFGDVQVLSSPKVMALNNQTSILKVVDNRVYFTIEVETIAVAQVAAATTFETDVHTVPVGLVMSLVPYISETNEIILNIRPTISRIIGFVNDPNPELAREGVTSPIPEIQVREMESVLRLNDGQVAVIGGLMQDSLNKSSAGVPFLSRVPGVGNAFKFRNDNLTKTELVIFLRTTVIKDPSLDGDLKQFREYLPVPTAFRR